MIDLIPIDPTANWTPEKKRMHEHLQLLTGRILEKQVDVTSNFGSDLVTVALTYAIFGDQENANYHKVCGLAKDYNYDQAQDKWKWATEKGQLKSLRKFLTIVRFHGIDDTYLDESVPEDEAMHKFLPDGADGKFFETYGFYESKHQYFTLEPAGKGFWKPVAFTNFAMRVLFHMNNGMQPRRVIELVNNRGRKKIVDIPTDKLSSRTDFKKFCEGLGNFRFFGPEQKLDMLKAYLYETENECQEISVLGWHEDGFWAWSNGVFNAKFSPVDMNGFVELHEKHYYLPAGNTQQPNRTRRFSNELRFKHHIDSSRSFQEWSSLYFKVFGINGAVILTFSMACLFSDIIFNAKNFFPLLFVYGEGGSGKGSAIKMAQRIFGIPQDPLTLSGKANTDKAKIAVFAQFVNSMLLLEEYVPQHDTDQLLKNLWDRYGYKRRTMDMGYGTETVPIQSGVAITGNFSPSDDPLLQRLIYLEHNINQFTDDQRTNFNRLKEMSEAGITDVTHEILRCRAYIEEWYRVVHQEVFREVGEEFSGGLVTDRMIENICVLLTIHDLLVRNKVEFPFTRKVLFDYLIKATRIQNEKRDSGQEAQKFFQIFYTAVQAGDLKEDIHFKLNGDNLYFNLSSVYGIYSETHRKMHGISGLTMTNLRDKLKVHPSYSGYEDSVRISDSIRSSCYIFFSSKTGVNLIQATEVFKSNRMSANALNRSFAEKLEAERAKITADNDELFPEM